MPTDTILLENLSRHNSLGKSQQITLFVFFYMKTYGIDASWRGLQYAVSKLTIGREKPFFLAKILIIFYHVIALSYLKFLRLK